MPCWNEKLTLTASPRFSFASSATLTPPARVSLVVRLSMFPGVGSNASPWVTALPPVYLDTSAATSGGAGISARGGGSSVGRNQPSVRFEAFRYAFATARTSSGVTSDTRSRCRNMSRQSPIDAHSLNSIAMAPGSLNARSKPAAIFVLARPTSSVVGGSSASPCKVASMALVASRKSPSRRTAAQTISTPGSLSWKAVTEVPTARPVPTRFL